MRSPLLVFIAVIALTLCCSVSGHARPEVALIHSVARQTAWTDSLAEGMADVVGDHADIAEVYLGDPPEDAEFFHERFRQISSHWGNSMPVAVVADGELAFAFMRKYREDLFAAAPVVYCGMSRPAPELLAQCGDCTGVPLESGVDRTLGLLFAVRPDTHTVVGVMDGTPASRLIRAEVERAMEPYLDRARLLFPGYEPGDDGGMDMELLRSVAASVPSAGAVLYLGVGADNRGERVDPGEALDVLARRSVGPVLILTDRWSAASPGQVLGGVFVRAEAQGAAVGRTVLRIMGGERAGEMLPESVEPVPVVDMTTMARFGIAKSALPDEAVLLNEPTAPERDGRIASTELVIALAGLTVVFMLYLGLRRRRRSA